MPLMGSFVDWTWLRKESLNKDSQQKFPKLKRRKNMEKNRIENPRTMEQRQKV